MTINKLKACATFLLAISSLLGYSQKKPKLSKDTPAIEEGDYATAKMIVDAAIEHEKTKDDPQTWFLRGQVYGALDTANNEPGALEEAMKAFDKALEIDPEQKKINSLDFATGSVVNVDSKRTGLYAHYYNAAIAAYNEEDFEDASSNFETAYFINPSDTNAILNAAYSASAAGLEEKANENFKQALEAGSIDKNIFLQLYNYAVKNEDMEGALASIQRGRESYPDDIDLMKYEVNLFIQMERTDEARKGLEEAIAADPKNPDLLFALGVLKEETGEMAIAEEYYRKAIAADPNHFNSNFNLAVYVFNKANEMMKERNELGYREDKKIKAITAKIDEQLKNALPLWEKLYSLKSTDETVLETLSYIYTNLKMNDKAEKMEDELDALKG
ncbi:MAG: tetratricopeptide repeat protein [Bacteroidota bacterium]